MDVRVALHRRQQGQHVFVFRTLHAGGQQLMPLDLPHDGQHIDPPLLPLDEGCAQVHQILRVGRGLRLCVILFHVCHSRAS